MLHKLANLIYYEISTHLAKNPNHRYKGDICRLTFKLKVEERYFGLCANQRWFKIHLGKKRPHSTLFRTFISSAISSNAHFASGHTESEWLRYVIAFGRRLQDKNISHICICVNLGNHCLSAALNNFFVASRCGKYYFRHEIPLSFSSTRYKTILVYGYNRWEATKKPRHLQLRSLNPPMQSLPWQMMAGSTGCLSALRGWFCEKVSYLRKCMIFCSLTPSITAQCHSEKSRYLLG